MGEKAKVRVLRKGKELTLDVTLGRLEEGEKLIAAARQPEPTLPEPPTDLPDVQAPGLKDLLGLDVGPIDEEAREAFDIGADLNGLVITDVVDGSDAERQGLLTGLVITEVNQQEVSSIAELTEQIDAAKEAGRPAVLFKVTDPAGTSRFVAVKLEG